MEKLQILLVQTSVELFGNRKTTLLRQNHSFVEANFSTQFWLTCLLKPKMRNLNVITIIEIYLFSVWCLLKYFYDINFHWGLFKIPFYDL